MMRLTVISVLFRHREVFAPLRSREHSGLARSHRKGAGAALIRVPGASQRGRGILHGCHGGAAAIGEEAHHAPESGC
jgi:hypothetical protein